MPSLATLALLCLAALALDSAVDGQSETSSALLEPHVQEAARGLVAGVVGGEPSEKGIEEASTVVGFFSKYGCAWAEQLASVGDPKVAARVRELFPAPAASAAPSQSSATSTEPAPTPIADAAPVTSELTADAEAATV